MFTSMKVTFRSLLCILIFSMAVSSVKAQLRNPRNTQYVWNTDTTLREVDLSEIILVLPRNSFPKLDYPDFIGKEKGLKAFINHEPVIAVAINNEAKAYPLSMLTMHEMSNDSLGGIPILPTYCPLCNSSVVYDRRLTYKGKEYLLDFEASGMLRNSDMVMADKQTESWWQQLTGESLVGVMAGSKLKFLAAPIVSWSDFMTLQPDGEVLSKDTGLRRRYGENPYVGYDTVDLPPFLYTGELDGRLQPKERVAAITVDGVDAAFPFSILAEEGVVNYLVNETDVAVFFKKGTNSALGHELISFAADIGSTAVYNAEIDGQKLTFSAAGDAFTDTETGSTWNILGEATNGPMTGKSLTKIVNGDHFWFAWGAFKPDTLVYQGER